jgi:hypothetical protein
MLSLIQVAQESQSGLLWTRILQIFVGSAVTVIIYMLEGHRRSQNSEREESARKHAENTKRLDNQDIKLDMILHERKYIPSHAHREVSGPLTVEGIYFPPKD